MLNAREVRGDIARIPLDSTVVYPYCAKKFNPFIEILLRDLCYFSPCKTKTLSFSMFRVVQKTF